MEDWKENIGYLCRWCALCVAALVIFLVGWLTLRTMVSAPAELSARLIVPDFLSYPAHGEDRINLRCWVESDATFFRSVLWNVGEGLHEAESIDSHIYLCTTDTPSRSMLPIRVDGNPYSSVGFQQAQSMLRIAPAGSGLFVVDARMVRSGLRDAAALEEYRAALAQMRRQGAVVLFVPGPKQEMAEIRRELGSYHFDDAIMCQTDPGDLMQAVHGVYGDYYYSAKWMVVVTDDETIALGVRAQGWNVRYICPTKASPKLEPYRFASLTNFKDSLPGPPITK